MRIRRASPVNIIVHFPSDKSGREELSRRVAEVRANAVISQIQKLPVSAKKKRALLDRVTELIK